MVIKLNNKKYIALLISSIVIVVVATISITYAYLSFSNTQEGTNTLSTGCYNISFEDTNSINITSYPMSSATAFRTIIPYTFKITNTCETPSNYQVILNISNTTSTNLLPYINYSLDGTSVNKLSSLATTTPPSDATSSNVLASYILDTGSLATLNSTETYNLHLWIDESAGNDIMNSKFQAEVVVYNQAG